MIRINRHPAWWLVLTPMALGIIVLIAGQLPIPTFGEVYTATGGTARVGGVGFIALGFAFFGVLRYSQSDSALTWIIDRFFLAHIGMTVFAGCMFYVVMEIAKDV